MMLDFIFWSYSIYDVYGGGQFYILMALGYLIIGLIVNRALSRIGMDVKKKLAVILISCLNGVLAIYFPQFFRMSTLTPLKINLFVMPILILNLTYRLDLTHMRKCLRETVLLCLTSFAMFMIIGTFMTATFVKDPFDWVNLMYILSMSSIDSVTYSEGYKEYEDMRTPLIILEGEFMLGLCLGYSTVVSIEHIETLNVNIWIYVVIFIAYYYCASIIAGLLIGKVLSVLILHRCIDVYCTICGVVTSVYSIYFVIVMHSNMSGVISIFIISLYLSHTRSRMRTSLDTLMQQSFDLLMYIIGYLTYLAMVTEIICNCYDNIESMFFEELSLLFVGEFARVIVLVILYPLLNRSGNLKKSNYLVLFWFAKRGLPQLLLMMLVQDSNPSRKARWIFFLLCYILIHHLMANLTTNALLRLCQLNQNSQAKKINELNCVRLIEHKRMIFIETLKLDRYMSDCKWLMIEENTSLLDSEFPMTYELSNSRTTLWRERKSFCKDCHKDVTISFSNKEQYQMIVQAKLIALDAEKVSAVQQFEKGLITKNVLGSILHNLEKNREKDGVVIYIDSFINKFRKQKCIESLRETFVDINRRYSLTPPRNRCCQMLHYIVTNEFYELFLYIMVIVYFIDFYEIGGLTKANIYVLSIFYNMIFIVDFILKMWAYGHTFIMDGFKVYFSYSWNRLESVVVPLSLFIFFVVLMVYSPDDKQFNFYVMVWPIQHMRIIRFVGVLYKMRLRVIWMCNKIIGQRLANTYSIGMSVLVCYNEAVHMLPILVTRKQVCDDICTELRQMAEQLTAELFRLQIMMPEIAITLTTQQVSRVTLSNIKQTVKSLRATGVIDEYEYRYLTGAIEMNFKLIESTTTLSVNTHKMIFYDQKWFADVDEVDVLFSIAVPIMWEPAEVVLEPGTVPIGVYIITEGIMKQNYTPTEQILKNLEMFGILPVLDYISSTDFSVPRQTRIVAGNAIGLLSVLTGRPYDSVIIAQTKCKGYFVPKSVILEIIKATHSSLYNNMWKFIAGEIVSAAIWAQPLCKDFTLEQLYCHMRKAYVPDLTDLQFCTKDETVDDIFLIEGVVEEIIENDTYVGPCYLPRTICKLRLNHSVIKTTLMIIPMMEIGTALRRVKSDIVLRSGNVSERSLFRQK